MSTVEGTICTVYDIILNPDVTSKTKDDASYRNLLIELCVAYIQQKHNQTLSKSNLSSQNTGFPDCDTKEKQSKCSA